jgi:hypothetical protein
VTNSLQNRAIKKFILEILVIVILNLTFNFNPRKTDFCWKKSKNEKNLISEKTWQKILYKIGVSKSIIREAEISTHTPLTTVVT